MSDDACRYGPRLYGLCDGLGDELSADNDQGEDVREGPTLEEIIERMRLNGLDDPEQP
ncbi:MAG TPA: hypothetical protein VFE39_01605 [Pseudonocardia sp.]|jgi:hypothetical protein|nr:hypothetical protein [Pseudonocardia sp.]